MTYLHFHLVFLIPPLLLLAPGFRRSARRLGRRATWALPLVALIALVYTTPWDNYLVARGIWWYGEDRVMGTIGFVPVEEYLFFVLQPLLTGGLLYRLLASGDEARRFGDGSGRGPASPAWRELGWPETGPRGPGAREHGWRALGRRERGGRTRGWRELDSGGVVRVAGAAPWLLLTTLGVVLLVRAGSGSGGDAGAPADSPVAGAVAGASSGAAGTYLGLILVWATPVLAAMWLYMGPAILALRRPALTAVVLATFYLWLADAVAIASGIWEISPEHTLGWSVPGLPPLPVEEAVFFLLTNLLVVFGTILFLAPGMEGGRNPGRSR